MSNNKFSLKDRNVLITGAAGLLGEQHAISILELGGSVILTDISEADLLGVSNNLSRNYRTDNIHTYLMDVKDLDSIRSTKELLKENDIRVDVLINNAAIDPKVSSKNDDLESTRLENFDLAQWNLEIEVGLTGAFLCSQIFGNEMSLDKKGGVILNIASDLSVFSPDQRIYKKNNIDDRNQPVKPVTYSVIKSGLIGLTKYLSTYWVDYGVRCNALSPGGIYTDQNDDFVKNIEALIPLGRMANKDEYQAAVQFLCSDASSYMNGQNIIIDGGRSVW